jgi:hypothetical protein
MTQTLDEKNYAEKRWTVNRKIGGKRKNEKKKWEND